MSSLRPEDRALFGAARRSFEPTDEDRARIGRALGLPVGAALGVAAATTTASSAAAATAAAGAGAALQSVPVAAGVGGAAALSFGKWLAIVTIVAGAGGTAAVVTARSAPVPAPPPASQTRPLIAAAPTPPPVAATPTLASPAAPVLPPAAETAPRPTPVPAPLATAATTTPSAVHEAPRPLTPATEPAEPVVASVSVGEEARLLREADAALRAGDLSRAGVLLDEHARTFPRGVLVEERDAERVLLLCAEGDAPAARAEGERFLVRHSQSPLAARVRASCAKL